MRFCGIDVSAHPGQQHLVTLEARPREGEADELVATFFEVGTVDEVEAAVRGLGDDVVVGVDAPNSHRLDLLAPGAPMRERLGLPVGRYERLRVCDALLFRRGLPLYPVPAPGAPTDAWERWIAHGFDLFDALQDLGGWRPAFGDDEALDGPVGEDATRFGRLVETYPDAVFSVLLGHRPSPKRTPWGLQQRIASLKLQGVVDPDGGLWHRTVDELDACAVALAARALAGGEATWAGAPQEGVIVLPGAELQARYDKLPPPSRRPLGAPQPA